LDHFPASELANGKKLAAVWGDSEKKLVADFIVVAVNTVHEVEAASESEEETPLRILGQSTC